MDAGKWAALSGRPRLPDLKPRRIVEHAGVVAPQKLACKRIAGGFVHRSAIHLAAAVNAAVLTDKMLVFCRNVVFDCKRRLRTQLAAQVGVRCMDEELIGLRRVVAELIEDPLSELILRGKAGREVRLSVEKNKITVTGEQEALAPA